MTLRDQCDSKLKQKTALVHCSIIISEMIKYLIVFYSLSCTFSELNYLIIAEFYVVNGHNRLMITYFKDIISKSKLHLRWDNLLVLHRQNRRV